MSKRGNFGVQHSARIVVLGIRYRLNLAVDFGLVGKEVNPIIILRVEV